ncbi:hypothetical protein SRHO_G00074150, partial [Serrasalmus rhombeus]
SNTEEVDDNYRRRRQIQLFNVHSSGNFSLFIPHLTEEDEGMYSCSYYVSDMVSLRSDVKVTVQTKIITTNAPTTSNIGQAVTVQSTTITTNIPTILDLEQAGTDSHPSQSVTYFPLAVVATLIFHIVVAFVFLFKKPTVPVLANAHYSTADPEETLNAPMTLQLQRINQAEEIGVWLNSSGSSQESLNPFSEHIEKLIYSRHNSDPCCSGSALESLISYHQMKARQAFPEDEGQ